jgi:hypothetical protein
LVDLNFPVSTLRHSLNIEFYLSSIESFEFQVTEQINGWCGQDRVNFTTTKIYDDARDEHASWWNLRVEKRQCCKLCQLNSRTVNAVINNTIANLSDSVDASDLIKLLVELIPGGAND